MHAEAGALAERCQDLARRIPIQVQVAEAGPG
jgi:hypothetical protein